MSNVRYLMYDVKCTLPNYLLTNHDPLKHEDLVSRSIRQVHLTSDIRHLRFDIKSRLESQPPAYRIPINGQ